MKAAAKYLLLTVLILITVSCTKKNEANLLENELLNRLPENTAGFLITKLDGEPGKKLRDTPWGQSSDKNSKIIESRIGEANGKLAKEVAFGKSLEESFAKSQSILFCFLPRDKSKFSVAGLVKAENSESAKEISRLFKEKIDAEGHKVEEIQIADVSGLRISIPEDNLELYIASKNEYISLGNDLELTSKLIDQSKASPEVITKIKATPSFISAREKVTVDQNTLAFGYIDSSQLTDFYFKAEQDKTKQNPLNSVIYVRSFDDGLNDHGVISTNENALVANNKSLKDLSSGLSLLNNAASSSISYFGISGNLIKIIAEQLQ
ncbi:MAG: hypothetical protein R3A13_11190 [Bdellovibrionota bacterium]